MSADRLPHIGNTNQRAMDTAWGNEFLRGATRRQATTERLRRFTARSRVHLIPFCANPDPARRGWTTLRRPCDLRFTCILSYTPTGYISTIPGYRGDARCHTL